MELEISKRYFSFSFHRIPSKLYEDIACHGGMQPITLLGNRPSFHKICGTLKYWSQLENLNCGISRKWLTVEWNGWNLGLRVPLNTHMEVTFDARFIEFGWGWFCALRKISKFTIFKTLFLYFIQSIIIMGLYRLLLVLAICQKLKKIWHFEFFLTQDHMPLEISKCYFSKNFHWSPPKLYENICYHAKSKCLLEYCNEKFASST